SPSTCSSTACASDQYASLRRTIAAPSRDTLSGKWRYSHPRETPATSATSDTVVDRMPLARRQTSAASISRSRTFLVAVLLVTTALCHRRHNFGSVHSPEYRTPGMRLGC